MKKNGFIKVLFKHLAFGEDSTESAWAKFENGNYVLDNILFYAKEYSIGDILSVIEKDGEFHAEGLIKESGHSTLRILFSDDKYVNRARKELKEMGCSSELSNINILVSIDIPPSVNYKSIIDYLSFGENKGFWEYEEACISTLHRNQY